MVTKPEWADAERIANIPIVDDALRGFLEDPTGDNGVCVVLAVLDAATSAAPAAEEVRNQALEEAATMLLNGRFLHDEAPPKLFAKEAAAAIREMKRAASTEGGAA